MDVENGYFLVNFQNSEDFEKVLCQGLWIVYDQYLTVQPWTVDFNTTQAYLSMVMVLINEVLQRVKYWYLPTVCFLCVHYGHVKELFTKKESGQKMLEGSDANGKGEQRMTSATIANDSRTESKKYGLWMLMERISQRPPLAMKGNDDEVSGVSSTSWFHALETLTRVEYC
ncbi:hypothetical protein GOBAR_AA36452 [Gossypium barbadense]|uniref:DUF4283 domain-containing protein n=1 Tax=Gossypium barbadense TaxID=3634 RepID=A0A2P5VZJ8_GOSBA|nr:hypothetical protein GOBAR_AA36452 [Gossypium barbadense]